MTVDEIDAEDKRQLDTLKRAFMRGDLNREQFDKAVKELDEWTVEQYKALKITIKQEKQTTLNLEDWLNLLDWAAGAVKRGSLTSKQYEELAVVLRVWMQEQAISMGKL